MNCPCQKSIWFSFRNSRRGFTLFEILIVIVILAILAAAAAPNFRQFYIQTVQEDATRAVATVLKTAQNLAVIHRVQMQVEFDLEKNRYQVIADPSITKEWKEVPRFARPHDLPEGVKFRKVEFNTEEKDNTNSKVKTLNFYANGSSDGGEIYIYGNKLKSTTKIQIKKTTGNVIVTVQSIDNKQL